MTEPKRIEELLKLFQLETVLTLPPQADDEEAGDPDDDEGPLAGLMLV